MLDIIKVMTDSFGKTGVATKTVHLSPACDAGFHSVARIVMWDLMFKVPDQLRALRSRANEAHFPFEHVPELRRLVDVPFSHKRANSEPAWVVFRRPTGFPVLFSVQPHTADL